MKKIAEEYINMCSRPGRKNSSVHYGYRTRYIIAKEQEKLTTIKIRDIIKYTKEFLELLGMSFTVSLIKKRELIKNNLYKDIKEKNNLDDERDIVWMKFTKDGFLGVVATSNDINFQIPKDPSEYNEMKTNGKWKYNTSGIIIHHLEKKWDDRFVLILPLQNLSEKRLKRGDIESGIGNYLIEKNVPILDFFSHRY